MSLLKNLKGWYKGWDGELTVKLMQWRYLDKKTYHVFNNITLPNFGGGTTQIDHIIVSVYGIFVVETKNMDGWIYGKEKERTWTQVFPNKKNTYSKIQYTKTTNTSKQFLKFLKSRKTNSTLLSCLSEIVNSKQICLKTFSSRVTPNTLKTRLKKF